MSLFYFDCFISQSVSLFQSPLSHFAEYLSDEEQDVVWSILSYLALPRLIHFSFIS
jgi:hypothetical protein